MVVWMGSLIHSRYNIVNMDLMYLNNFLIIIPCYTELYQSIVQIIVVKTFVSMIY
jgi:hypothetical protein